MSRRDTMGLRVPPHSTEAEQSVLGGLLMDNQAFDRVADLLTPKSFYNPEHGAIYATISRLIAAGKPADAVTVHEAGDHPHDLLQALALCVPSAAHARRYAEIVAERALERALVCAGDEIAAMGFAGGGDVAGRIDRAAGMIAKLGEGTAAKESVTVQDAVLTYMDWLSDEAEGRTQVISTGLRALDRMLAGGLRRGELMVVGARPKMGKTAFTLALARAMAKQHGVLILSQEMPVHELVSRHVAALGSVNLADLRRPAEMDSLAWGRVAEAVEAIRPLNIVLDDQCALTLLDVRRKVMAAKRKHGCDVVIIDFLQLMAGDGDNRNQELDRISNGIKAMCKEFDVAALLLSQLTREADKRHGPPVMTDLRDCGAIEAAADIIALMYREFAHPLGSDGEEWEHHAQLEIVQRNGAPGTVHLYFSGEYQQFKDWDGPLPLRPSGRSTGKGLG